MSKGLLSIPFERPSTLIESKQIKGSDIIRVQPIGTRKEYCLKFDVSVCNILSPHPLSSLN